MSIHLTAMDWLNFFSHFLVLSLLAVGGAITTAPDMHRYLVDRQHWLSDPQFASSIAIAQAAPGPNVLFVGLLGWNVGMNAAGLPGAGLGLFLSLLGILLPSATLTYVATRWAHRHRGLRAVRVFKHAMTPIVLALLVATGWLLATGSGWSLANWPIWLLSLASAALAWRTRIHLLWLLGAGAALGWFGWL